MITIMILERDARREVLRRDVGAQRGLRAQRHAAGGGREAPSIINNGGSSGGRRRRVLRRRRGRGRCCGRWGERLDVLPTAQHAASTQRPPGHGLWEHERSDWLYCIRKGGTEEDEERKGSWKRGAELEGVRRGMRLLLLSLPDLGIMMLPPPSAAPRLRLGAREVIDTSGSEIAGLFTEQYPFLFY